MNHLSPLDAHLGYWLRFVSNHVSHAFGQKLAGRGVTVAEWVVLREMHGVEALAPSALADRLGLTRGAISRLVDRLEAKALITRSAGEGDGRFQSLALTSAGHALVPELSALADRNDAEFFGHLPPGERKQVEAVMKEIVRRHGLKSIPIA